MSTPIGLESDISDPYLHALSGRGFLVPWKRKQVGQLEAAPARTLTSVLLEAEAPRRIDLLSIDVEGAELEVLRGLDFTCYSVHWILVECRDFPPMAEFMVSNGFELHSKLSGLDYLFRDALGAE